MNKLNIGNFNLKTIHRFQALLNQFESEGVTDIRFVRQQLQRVIDTQHRNNRGAMRRDITAERKNRTSCPSCGRGWLNPIHNKDGLNLLGCSACRYSEVV